MDLAALPELLEAWGYPALLLLLLLTGIGSPIPEDLLLVTAGYLVFTDVLWWPLAAAVSIGGVIGSDLILYAAGRRFAWRPPGVWDARLVSPKRLQRVTRWFDRLGPIVVFGARLLPGTRAIVFITAGVRGLPASRFLLYDALGAFVWVPLLLLAGHELGDRIGGVDQVAQRIQEGAVWILGLAGVLFALWLVWGREESKL